VIVENRPHYAVCEANGIILIGPDDRQDGRTAARRFGTETELRQGCPNDPGGDAWVDTRARLAARHIGGARGLFFSFLARDGVAALRFFPGCENVLVRYDRSARFG
jgi:hypothetical protein